MSKLLALKKAKEHEQFDHILDTRGIVLGKSPAMKKLYDMVKRIAVTDHHVLITGPTGAGKEVVASLIQRSSNHPDSLFIDVNCGAIPETLIESHLFGHEKGAFTGAVKKHEGYFSSVGNGTLFLDEIAELSLVQQTKLLRVLETRFFRPVGSNENIRFHGRIIAATHTDLEQMIAEKTFREDLFYRLSVFHLKVPGLSERREDIPEFINLFSSYQKQPFGFTKKAKEMLSKADWPGNIRQLKNMVNKIAILCDENPVTSDAIKPYVLEKPEKTNDILESIAKDIISLDINNKLSAIEHMLIKLAMDNSMGNKSKAAEILGVHRKYIERRLKSFDANIEEVYMLNREGENLMSGSLYMEALELYKRALKLLDKYTGSAKLEEIRLELLIKLVICIRNLSGWNASELKAIYQEAKKLGKKLNKIDKISTVQFGVWVRHLMNLELDKALESAKELLTEGIALNSPYMISQAYISLSNTYFWRGDFSRADENLFSFIKRYHFDKELLIDYGQDPFVLYLMLFSLNSFQLGRVKKSIEVLSELFEYSLKINHPFSRAIALQTGSWLEYKLGNYDKSYKHARDLVELSKKNSFVFYQGIGMIFRGYWIAENMNLSEGKQELKEGYNEMMLRNGGFLFNSMYAVVLGTLCLKNNEYEEGVKLIDQSIRVSMEKNELCYLSDMVTLKGKFCILVDDFEQAEKEFNKAIFMAVKTESVTSELNAGIELAKLKISRGNNEAAKTDLSSIVARFSDEGVYSRLIVAKQLIND